MCISNAEKPEAMVNRIQREVQSRFPGSIPLIVEGADDKQYFSTVTNHPKSCTVVPVDGREKVLNYFAGLSTLKTKIPEKSQLSLGIIDRDNDDERPPNGSIFITDSRDTESMIFLSGCADYVVRQFLPKSIEHGLDPIRLLEHLHLGARAIGALHRANERAERDRQISIRRIPLENCFDARNLTFKAEKLWEKVSNANIRNRAIEYFRSLPADLTAFGHAYETLLIHVAVCDRWKEYDTKRAAEVDLEKIIRGQFPHAFSQSVLKEQIVSWEDLHGKSILLAPNG